MFAAPRSVPGTAQHFCFIAAEDAVDKIFAEIELGAELASDQCIFVILRARPLPKASTVLNAHDFFIHRALSHGASVGFQQRRVKRAV